MFVLKINVESSQKQLWLDGSERAGRTYVGPTGRCWGSGSLGKAPAACPSGLKPCGCSSPDLDETREKKLWGCGHQRRTSRRSQGPFTFCANSGFPESLLRCMNSKCRVPYSARMLLPPDAHGQFLPMPLQKTTGRRMFEGKRSMEAETGSQAQNITFAPYASKLHWF